MTFLPNPATDPGALDLAMRASLASSIEYIHSVAKHQLDCSNSELAAALAEITTHRVKPGLFGRYYRLVLALERDSRSETRELFRNIITQARETPVLRIVPFSVQALGPDQELYGALIDPVPTGLALLAAPDAAQWNGFDGRVAVALAIIERTDPALGREIRALVVDVVGAAPAKGDQARPFGSASSFMLWGALLINLCAHRTVQSVVEALVHESAHQLLFAHAIDRPLVLNALDERYPSPLRPDSRPMDGVFHATFVTARMYYMLRRLRSDPSHDAAPLDRAVLDRRLETLRASFGDGLDTVQRFGHLSPDGARIMAEAADYMRSA